jgi:uncharacterized RDD family membrane protein YckC
MDRYSTFGARFVAGLIDGLVLLPVSIIGFYFVDSPDDGVALFLIWSAIAYSSYWLYSVLLHARYGQTLGKRAMGVKVLDVSESRIPTLSQAFLRDAVYIAVNTITLAYLFFLVLGGEYTQAALTQSAPARTMNWVGFGWFLTEVVTMLMNDKRRALHDFIARTVVVRGA